MACSLVLADYVGRLGNRLCLFIHVLAVAMENGFGVCNLTLQPHASWFEELSRNSWCRYPAPARGWPMHRWVRGFRAVVEWAARRQRRGETVPWPGICTVALRDGERLALDQARFLEICSGHRWVILWGWSFRADSCLQRHQDAICRFLRMREGLDPELEKRLKTGSQEHDWQIAMHIRQGDFRTWQGGKYFVPPGVFARHAWKIREAHPNKKIQFWICSDEPVELTQFPPETQTSPGQTLREDLRILTSCGFILGGTSTLAHAAAFLGRGRIHDLNLDKEPSLDPGKWPEGWSALGGQP